MKTPTFREFTIEKLADWKELTDMQLMDLWGKKYCRWNSYAMIAKKLESYRKVLWLLKKKGLLEVTNKRNIPIKWTNGLTSSEITYKLK